MKEYILRAHHGICLAFFAGKGYSNDFISHMAEVKRSLEENPMVRIVKRTDEICSACPNHKEGICDDDDKVLSYDQQVLSRCGLKEETVMPFLDFRKLVYDRILVSGKREEICGDCEWSALCHIK